MTNNFTDKHIHPSCTNMPYRKQKEKTKRKKIDVLITVCFGVSLENEIQQSHYSYKLLLRNSSLSVSYQLLDNSAETFKKKKKTSNKQRNQFSLAIQFFFSNYIKLQHLIQSERNGGCVNGGI